MIVILDVPDNSEALGPSPLLQRSSSQQDPHTASPSAVGSAHPFLQVLAIIQPRLKVVTEPSLRIVFTIAQLSSRALQVVTRLLPTEEAFAIAQYLRASGLSSRTQL